MRRRRLLGLVAGSGTGALAGCGGGGGATTRTTTAFPRDPDDPGADLPASRGVRVENRSGARRYVTVAVSRDGETVFGETFEVAGEGLARTASRQAVVARSGTYRVAVEAVPESEGEPQRAAFDWCIEGALGDLTAVVEDGVSASDRGERADGSSDERSESDGVSFWQSARCTPDCAPVSTGGEATAMPFDPRDREDVPQYVGAVVVENPSRETREVTLRVVHEGESVLEYGYAVPPRVRLRVPAVAWPGAYTVEATAAGVTRSYDWGNAVLYTVSVTLGPDGPTFGCGEVAGRVILVNATDRGREFAVAVRRDGERLWTGSVRVPANDDRQVATGVTAIGRYTLRVGVDGESVERAWGPCTPATVTLAEDGTLRLIGGKRAGSSPAVTAGRAGRPG